MALTTREIRLQQNVRLYAPGALDAVIQLEFYNTAKEFFNDTNVWQNTVDVAITPPTTSYTVTPTDTPSEVIRLLEVKNDNNLDVVGLIMRTPGTLEFDPATTLPSEATTYSVTIALTCIDPTDSNNYPTFPTWILDKYDQYLMAGTIGRLLMQPAKPYSNTQLGLFHLRKFREGVGFARSEAAHGNVYRGQSWRYPQAWGVRRKYGGTSPPLPPQ